MRADPTQKTRPESMPSVRFTGQGIYVNGAWIDGDVVLAWVRFAADRGYVLKLDKAIDQGLHRTEEPANIGVFDAITNLIEIAGASAL